MHGKRNIYASNVKKFVDKKYQHLIKSRVEKEKIAWAYIRSPDPAIAETGYQILYDLLRLDSKNARARNYLYEMGYGYFPGFPNEFLKRPTMGCISPDKRFLALASEKTIQIVEVETKDIVHTFSLEYPVKHVKWIDDEILYIAKGKLISISLSNFTHTTYNSDLRVVKMSPSGKSVLAYRSGEKNFSLFLCRVQFFPNYEIIPMVNIPNVVINIGEGFQIVWSYNETKLFIRKNVGKENDTVWILNATTGATLERRDETEKYIGYLLGDTAYVRHNIEHSKSTIFGYPKKILATVDLSTIPQISATETLDYEQEWPIGETTNDEVKHDTYVPLEVTDTHVFYLSGNSILLFAYDYISNKLSIVKPRNHVQNLSPGTEFPQTIMLAPKMWLMRRPLETKKKRQPEFWEYGKYGFEEDEFIFASMDYERDRSHPPNEKLSCLSLEEQWSFTDIGVLSINTEHEPVFLQGAFNHTGHGVAAVIKETRRMKDYPDWKSYLGVRFFNIVEGKEYMNKWELSPNSDSVLVTKENDTTEYFSELYDGWNLQGITNIEFSYDNRYLALGGRFHNNYGMGGEELAGGLVVRDLKEKTDHAIVINQFVEEFKEIDEHDPDLFGSSGLYPFLGMDWDQHDVMAIFPELSFSFSMPNLIFKGTMPTFVKKNRSTTIVVGYERFINTQNQFYSPNTKKLLHSQFKDPTTLEIMAGTIGNESPDVTLSIQAPKDIDNLNDYYSLSKKFGVRVNSSMQWFMTFSKNSLTSYSAKSKKMIKRIQLTQQILDIAINPQKPEIMVLTDDYLYYYTLPTLKKIRRFKTPNLLTDVNHNWFLRWNRKGECIAIFGRGLWIINIREVLHNLVISKHYDVG